MPVKNTTAYLGIRILLVFHLGLSPSVSLANSTAHSSREKSLQVDNPGSDSGLSEEQKIGHLLNRAGFGPRPGDIEKVRRIGMDRYLDLQLHPTRMSDLSLDGRLRDLKT